MYVFKDEIVVFACAQALAPDLNRRQLFFTLLDFLDMLL